jgi:hypothetical protein
LELNIFILKIYVLSPGDSYDSSVTAVTGYILDVQGSNLIEVIWIFLFTTICRITEIHPTSYPINNKRIFP